MNGELTPQHASSGAGARAWTDDQRFAIDARRRFLVVSAAAGSGKTSVLTERVLNLVDPPHASGRASGLDGDGAIALEKLLVVTFTEKAARQMRERIERRLLAALAERPDSQNLRAALDALSSAWIMTLHAFCLRVVSEHFHRVGLNPPVRVADPAEENELRRDAIEEALGRWGASREAMDDAAANRRARLAALLNAAGGQAAKLTDEISSLMAFLESLDREDEWLAAARENCAASEAVRTLGALPEMPEAGEAFAAAGGMLAGEFAQIIEEARLRGADAALLANWDLLRRELLARAQPGALLAPETSSAWLKAEADPTLGKIMNKGVCGAVLYADKQFVECMLKPFAKHYKDWRERWLGLGSAAWLRGARAAARQLATLIDVTADARAIFAESKRRRGFLTFGDMEHLAAQILTDAANPARPSEVAFALRARFEHVLVDEYQDTSPLQDAIIGRVTGLEDPEPGARAHLFIVGDLKQSIYRFRHAAPDLFQARLDASVPAREAAGSGAEIEDPRPGSINLDRNFRAQPDLIAFVNVCFERLMDRQIGGLDYDAMHRLVPVRKNAEGAEEIGVEAAWLSKDAAPNDCGGGPEAEESDDSADAAPENTDADSTEENLSETLSSAQTQAAYVAARLRAMTIEAPVQIVDPDSGELRAARPGDCAILLRSARGELDVWVRALEDAGLQALTPGLSPLFTAPELIDLTNALRIADNPFQDAALAGVMRSPLAAFSDEDLLRVRMARPSTRVPFHEALWHAAGLAAIPPYNNEEAGDAAPEELAARLNAFIERILRWGQWARRLDARETLERILEETRYEAWLLGKPHGAQGLANLDYLRGLASKLGTGRPGANPLATFLGRIDAAAAREEELGEIPEPVEAAGNAVHLLTVHKSKGLEFPIVVLPRLERALRGPRRAGVAADRHFGLGMPGYDAARRVKTRTPAMALLESAAEREDRAEEMRLLYVAMTRARDRLILVGRFKDAQAEMDKWSMSCGAGGAWSALRRLKAPTPAALLGPLIAQLAGGTAGKNGSPTWLRVSVDPPLPTPAPPVLDMETLRAALAREGVDPQSDWKNAGGALLASMDAPPPARTITLPPAHDPAAALTTLPAKIPVTQWAARAAPITVEFDAAVGAYADVDDAADELARFVEPAMQPARARELGGGLRAPAWAAQNLAAGGGGNAAAPSAAARGTLTHEFFAKLDLRGGAGAEELRAQAGALLNSGTLVVPGVSGESALAALDIDAIAWFFTTDAGRRMLAEPGRVLRELPFTARRSVADLAGVAPADAARFAGETILMQGVVDVVIDEGDAALIVDYKTDRIRDAAQMDALTEHYSMQLRQYAKSLMAIWGLRGVETRIAFLDARRLVALEPLGF